MLLTAEDAALFFRLHRSLMHFVNQQRSVVPGVASPEEFSSLPPETRLEVRKALLDDLGLIESFVDKNPAHLGINEQQIVLSWKQLVGGRFYGFRQLKKHMVFLSTDEPAVAYGVVALAEPFEQLIGSRLPQLVEAVLLPFKDKIVYDGLVSCYGLFFGGGVKRMLNDSYRRAKQRLGVITSLPLESIPISAATSQQRQKPKRPASTGPKGVKPILEAILRMTDGFCRERLDDEYAALCRQLAEKLSRKRPSPLLRSRPRSWACGIVRTIGWVNFLDDSSTQPQLKLTEIDKAFGVATSTGQAKSMEIRKLLKVQRFDIHWTLPSFMENNPLAWILEVDGLSIDVRDAPREVQELALLKGLIPYIPADRDASVEVAGGDHDGNWANDQVFQFKITLNNSQPAIWRRIQVPDCTLNQLHEHIQTAMGWTNSHLHQFQIAGERYGDPELLDDGFTDVECVDSTLIKIDQILPKDRRRFHFRYDYDFGDGWQHEVLFEGCPPRELTQQYPACVDGARACPPEDVGGICGYEEYLLAVADPNHERHEELLEWSGPFDPDAFDVAEATRCMRQKLPTWR